MSYNITKWKTKWLENLIIPIAAMKTNEREDFHPKIRFDENTGEKYLWFPLETPIKGVIEGENFRVTDICLYGEFSGTFFEEVLRPALAESTGVLGAVLIWENGDQVNRLLVENGVIQEMEIDL